mmetsp:Transcript_21269/g.47747  ORF Transcript_21269/g.47747 Transcript_21269/m.47747 type:complete len:215 (-) Transcript_21269:189-833(-)
MLRESEKLSIAISTCHRGECQREAMHASINSARTRRPSLNRSARSSILRLSSGERCRAAKESSREASESLIQPAESLSMRKKRRSKKISLAASSSCAVTPPPAAAGPAAMVGNPDASSSCEEGPSRLLQALDLTLDLPTPEGTPAAHSEALHTPRSPSDPLLSAERSWLMPLAAAAGAVAAGAVAEVAVVVTTAAVVVVVWVVASEVAEALAHR